MNKFEETQAAIRSVLLTALETIVELDDVYHTEIAFEVFSRLVQASPDVDDEARHMYLVMFAEWYLFHFHPNGRDVGIRFVLDQGFFESGSEAEAVAEALARTCAWRNYDVIAVRSDGRAVVEDAFTGRQEPFFSPALASFPDDVIEGRVAMFSARIDGVWYQAGPSIFVASTSDGSAPLPLLGIEEFYVRFFDDEDD